MTKFLDGDGLAVVWAKLKNTFAYKTDIKTPDWDAAEGEDGYIDHRTHYEEISGREYKDTDTDYVYMTFPTGASPFDVKFAYYANETIDSINELRNRTLTLVFNGEPDSGELEVVTDHTDYWTAGTQNDELVIYVINQTTVDGNTLEPGLYVVAGLLGVSVDSFELSEHNYVKQLDAKFIPSSVIPTVDQTYDDESTNAQSGTAVAEAIGGVTELIPQSTTTSNMLVNTSQLADAIDQNSKDYIAPDATMVVPFEYCTYIGGTTCLEDGPWFKDGVQCGTGTPPVYVVEGDYALVMKDESVCYFEAFGYRYQRHKDGGQTQYGYVVLPDANHSTTNIAQITSGPYAGALYFVDDSRELDADHDLLYIVTDLVLLEDSVHLYYASDPSEISGSPIAEYDLRFPSTRYRCSTAQTASTDPSWSFMYFVNDTPLTGQQIQALNSGVTSAHVQTVNNLATVATTGDYDDLSDKPVFATTSSSTANILNITAGGTTTTLSVPKTTNTLASGNLQPIESRAVYNALSGYVNKQTFEDKIGDVVHIVKDSSTNKTSAILIDDSGDISPTTAHCAGYNVYAIVSSPNMSLNRDNNTADTYYYIFDVDSVNGNLYMSVTGSAKLRACLTNAETPAQVKSRIESITSGTGPLYTYTGTWSKKYDSTSPSVTVQDEVIDNSGSKHAKTLIVYVGNTDTPVYISGATRETAAFLSSIDSTSNNAVQSSVIATEFAKYTPTTGLATVATSGDYTDLSNTPSIPTKTSDLTNDGEGGSPSDPFAKISDILVIKQDDQHPTSLKTKQGYITVNGDNSFVNSSSVSTINGEYCMQSASSGTSLSGDYNAVIASNELSVYGTARNSAVIASQGILMHGRSGNDYNAIIASQGVAIGAYSSNPPGVAPGQHNASIGVDGSAGTTLAGANGFIAGIRSYPNTILNNCSNSATIIGSYLSSGSVTINSNASTFFASKTDGNTQIGSTVSSDNSTEYGLSAISSSVSGTLTGSYNTVIACSGMYGTPFASFSGNEARGNVLIGVYNSGNVSISGQHNIIGAITNESHIYGDKNVIFAVNGSTPQIGDGNTSTYANAIIASNGNNTCINGSENLIAGASSSNTIGSISSPSSTANDCAILASYGVSITSGSNNFAAADASSIFISGNENAIIASYGSEIDGGSYNIITSSSGGSSTSANLISSSYESAIISSASSNTISSSSYSTILSSASSEITSGSMNTIISGASSNIASGTSFTVVMGSGITATESNTVYMNNLNVLGAAKGIKKPISTSDCTPDTYYCPATAATASASITFNDTNHTGNYNWSFSGYFENASTGQMTQMPAVTSSNISITWYGDTGLEAGEKYMFVATKVSATDYVGVVTKLS